MDIIIETLEGSVRDGITLLSKRRFNSKAPTYLIRPQSSLFIEILDMSHVKVRGAVLRQLKVNVRCREWGTRTNVRLTLADNGYNDELQLPDWLLWGEINISYGPDYPIVQLQCKKIRKTIEPRFFTKKGDLCVMEYRLGTPVD